MDIRKIIEDLRANGIADEQILPSLEQMLQEGKIAEEDLAKAKDLLEEADAERMLGLKFCH